MSIYINCVSLCPHLNYSVSKTFILPRLILNRKRARLQIKKDRNSVIKYISKNVHSPINVELRSANLCILLDIILNWNRTRVQAIKMEMM